MSHFWCWRRTGRNQRAFLGAHAALRAVTLSTNDHQSWDGTDAAGSVLNEGNYAIQLVALDAQGNQKIKKKRVSLVPGYPNALVLITQISTNPNDDLVLADTITNQLTRIKQQNSGFTFLVLVSNGTPASKKFRLAIRDWMKTTVTDFYVFAHGSGKEYTNLGSTPSLTHWGGIDFWASEDFPSDSSLLENASKSRERNFIIPQVVGIRPYNFVMIDSCNSAGGDDSPKQSNEEDFAVGFNILSNNPQFASAFFGWNGKAGINSYKTPSQPSNWLQWRQVFWTKLADGATVFQAAQLATLGTTRDPADINPWDGPQYGSYANYRATIIGDITTTLP